MPLKEAEKRGLTSVALPALGTGLFKFPVEECALVMLGAVAQFASSGGDGRSVSEVRFLAFDAATADVFREVVDEELPVEEEEGEEEEEEEEGEEEEKAEAAGEEQEDATSEGEEEEQAKAAPTAAEVAGLRIKADFLFMGSQCLRLCTGDLLKFEADAVVSASNAKLQHSGGLTAALVQLGGQCIQDESDAHVREHGEIALRPKPKVALTGGGSLPFRHIVHVMVPSFSEAHKAQAVDQLAAAVGEALYQAHRSFCHSVVFPALGAGGMRW